nr:glycoprot [Kampung Karu virus]
RCVAIPNRDFIEGTNLASWVDVVLQGKTCVTIMAKDKPTLDLSLESVEVEEMATVKQYCTSVAAGSVSTTAACPTTGEAHDPKANDESYFCKRGYSDRGWGNGCGLFGKGSIETCVQFNCEKKLVGKKMLAENTKHVIRVSVHGNMDYAKATQADDHDHSKKIEMTPKAPESTVALGEFGEVTVSCQARLGSEVEGMYVAMTDPAELSWLVHEEWFNDLSLPWTGASAQKWHEREKLYHFWDPKGTAQPVTRLGDQTGAVYQALAGARSVDCDGNKCTLKGITTTCRLKMEKLKLVG